MLVHLSNLHRCVTFSPLISRHHELGPSRRSHWPPNPPNWTLASSVAHRHTHTGLFKNTQDVRVIPSSPWAVRLRSLSGELDLMMIFMGSSTRLHLVDGDFFIYFLWMWKKWRWIKMSSNLSLSRWFSWQQASGHLQAQYHPSSLNKAFSFALFCACEP